ncbi:MAG: hypothetical protein P1U48_08565 [Pseudooceanicola sp.]|nr:hypothetical protein [Pseudooceanicola sp.]
MRNCSARSCPTPLPVLAPGAPFIQFTHAAHRPVSDRLQAALGIRATRRGLIWTKLPPARVFEFRALPH